MYARGAAGAAEAGRTGAVGGDAERALPQLADARRTRYFWRKCFPTLFFGGAWSGDYCAEEFGQASERGKPSWAKWAAYLMHHAIGAKDRHRVLSAKVDLDACTLKAPASLTLHARRQVADFAHPRSTANPALGPSE